MTRMLASVFAAFTLALPAHADESDLLRIVAILQAQVQALTQEVQTVKAGLDTCKANDAKQKWTEGRLCFLANGECPAGFQRSHGHIRAISIFDGRDHASSYLTPSDFGSSAISWHGTPYQYGHWAGELRLVTCCN